MKTQLQMWGVVSVIIGLIVLGVWIEVSVWNECRTTNSFLYCLRVLGK